jgi:hypothetical protein
VSTPVTGLTADTTYHFSGLAGNAGGFGFGSDAQFTTAAPPYAAEYGQCKVLTRTTRPKIKHGKYEDKDCQKLFTKNGTPAAKGNYEWFPGPSPSCEPVKKGEYTDSGCVTKASKKGKGKFERLACYPNCAGYTSVGGRAKLVIPLYSYTIECEKSTNEGAIRGSKKKVDVTVFSSCVLTTRGPYTCFNTGTEPEGKIATYSLETELYEADGKVFTRYQNKSGANAPYLVEFACGPIKVRIKGRVSGEHTGNINMMSKTSTDTLTTATGKQELEAEIGGGRGFAAPGPMTQEETDMVTPNDPKGDEVKAP